VRVIVALALTLLLGAPLQVPAREVVITIDDLPIGGTVNFSVADWERITSELVSALKRNAIPAIGFVNEWKLQHDGVVEPRRVAVLRKWLEAGLELGNHSFSHLDLHATPLDTFEKDVLRGERVTRALLAEAGRKLEFFRHPFLHTGRTLETKHAFELFLKEHGYRVAPVTIDNYDYVFANAFDRTKDIALRRTIADAYLEYMTDVVAFYERQSTAIMGREMRQVLLLHATALNANTMDALARMFKTRGYTFIRLERALEDPAYESADTYIGPGGITWLHRWALTNGKRGPFFAGEPIVPDWIEKAAARPIP
jgi:peptidoglycan/xylan/chitin deacetylase (PgdA/CDA1 family)